MKKIIYTPCQNPREPYQQGRELLPTKYFLTRSVFFQSNKIIRVPSKKKEALIPFLCFQFALRYHNTLISLLVLNTSVM